MKPDTVCDCYPDPRDHEDGCGLHDTYAALNRLAFALRSRIAGLPDHPWVPGSRFHDGELMVALKEALWLLEARSR